MKSINRKESKKIAVMAAVIMGFMVFAFLPLASAGVTDFTVTPSTGLAGSVDSYNVLVTTTGVTSINITIPEGFLAVTPMSGGVEIARVDFWNESTKTYYGYATMTSNDPDWTTWVDVHCEFGGATADETVEVNYAPGETNTFVYNVGGNTASAIITIPTENQKGSINLTITSTAFYLEDVHIALKQFVRNPLTAKDYDFFADGVKETVSITAPSGRATVFRNGRWFIDTDGDHVADRSFWYGLAADIPLVGNINRYTEGQKDDTIIFRDGKWFIDTDGDHVADESFWYGIKDDLPAVGDINQDGVDDTIIFRNGEWFVDTNYNQVADDQFSFGPKDKDYLPLVGDIDRDGLDDTIVFKDGNWIFDNDYDHDEPTAESFWFGIPGDIPLVEDINRDGLDDTAVFRNGKWFVDIDFDHIADQGYWYGIEGDKPVIGDFR
jgi:hypothetical protein